MSKEEPTRRHPQTPGRVAALALVLTLGTLARPARAALDSLCGTTLTADLTLDHDVDCTGYTGNALIIGASNVTVDGNGFRLLAPDSARAISISGGRSNVTVRNLSVEGWCTGIGIYLDGGSGHVFEDVSATGRSTGIDARNTTNLTLRRVRADSAATNGVVLTNVTRPLVLEGLVLTNNSTGLRLNTFAGPQTIDAAAIADLRGSDTGIWLEGTISQLTLAGLTLDGASYGVLANTATLSNVTFRDLDVSTTFGSGTGIAARGSSLVFERITANRRATGISVTNAADLVIDDLTANGAITTGLALSTLTGSLTLRKLTLQDDATALSITGYAPASQFAITAWDPQTGAGTIASLAKSDTGINLATVSNTRLAGLTLDNATYAINATSTANANLLFEDLDLSSGRQVGTGLGLGGPNHVVRRVIAHRRGYGLIATSTSNLQVSDFTSTGSNEGLRLATLAPPSVAPTFLRLNLTDNTTGLYLQAVSTPAVFDPSNLIDVRRSLTGITIAGASAALTFRDLAFDNLTTGISANGTDLVFQRVDFSGPGRGTGLAVTGTRATLDTVTATGRGTGFNLSVTQLVVTGLVANQCSTGLSVNSLSAAHTPPLMSALDLKRNSVGLSISSVATTAVMTIDGTLGFDVSECQTGIGVSYSSNIRFVGLTLPALYRGVDATSNNSALTFIDVDASGPGYSTAANATGLALGGANHVLANITANRRAIGVSIASAKGASITHLVARGATDTALSLTGVGPSDAPLTLSQLDLRDSGLGLDLGSITYPLVIDPSLGLDVRDANVGIRLTSCTDLIIRNLAFTTNRATGVYAYYNNTRLTFENLDVSGEGVGTGLYIGYLNNNSSLYYGGVDHVVRNVVADHRNVGVHAIAASNLTITGLTATHGVTGLRIVGYTNNPGYLPPKLTNLTLSDNNTGLLLTIVNGTELAPLVIDGYVPATQTDAITSLERNAIGIDVSYSTWIRFQGFSIGAAGSALWSAGSTGIVANYNANLTFRNLTLGTTGYGIHIQYGNSTCTFDQLDLSGQGTGVGLQLGYLFNNAVTYYGGVNHVLTQITANRRDTGVRSVGSSNLVINGLVAKNNASRGLHIDGFTNTTGFVPPTLSGLVLDDNATGLFLNNFGGTQAAPYDLGPSKIVSIANCGTNLLLTAMTNLRVHDLTLGGRSYGIDASGTGLTFADLDLSGIGQGIGLRVSGADPTLDRVTADRRDQGVFFNITSNPKVRDVVARQNKSVGLQFTTTTLPITLERLTVSDNLTGLRFSTVNGPGALGIGTAAITSHARSVTAITLSSAPAVTVDSTALGLTPSGGNFTAPAPSSAPLCGTTITTNLVLTADLDCSGITTTALTIGADNVTVDGGPSRYRIIAPRATIVIKSTNRNNVTLKRLDLSGTWATGDAISIDGGTGHRLEDLTLDRRDRGASLKNVGNLTVTNVSALGSLSAGLHLDTIALPLTLANLTLRDGAAYGLRVIGFNGLGGGSGGANFTIDGQSLSDVSGNATSIYFEGNVANVAVVGPIAGLDGTTQAIGASLATNASLTFSGLDLTPRWTTGTGLFLRGAGHQLVDLVADYRVTALDLRTCSSLIVDSPRIRYASTEALRLEASTTFTLRDLSLTRSAIGLSLVNVVGDGTTIGPWNALSDTGVITSLEGSPTAIQIAGTSNLTFADLTLDALGYGIQAASATNSGLTFTRLDLSGRQHAGIGLYLSGTNHVVTDVVANDRDRGLYTTTVTNLSVRGLRVDRAVTDAAYLNATTAPLLLENLTLTRSASALNLNSFSASAASPFIIDAYDGTRGTLASVAGSQYGVTLTAVQNAIVQDLTLPCLANAVRAASATNSDLLFRRLDVSGTRGAGTGLSLQGTRLVVDDVTADLRNTGVYAVSSTDLELRHLRARGAYAFGVQLATLSGSLTLVDLSVNNSAVGFYVAGYTAPPATPLVLGPYLPASGTGAFTSTTNCDEAPIKLASVQNVRLENLSLDGTQNGLSAYHAGNRNIIVQDVDTTPRRFGGTGIYIAGTDPTLTRVSSTLRGYGATAGSVSNLRVTTFVANRGSYGLWLQSTPNTPASYIAPTLSGLDVRRNIAGLVFYSWALPTTVDTSAGLDARECETGVSVTSNSANVTLRGLTLRDNPTQAITLNSTVTDVRVEDVDATGLGLGTGLTLSGATNVVVRNLTADRRTYGISANATPNLDVDGLTARFGGTGLYIVNLGAAAVAPTLHDLNLTDNGTGLYFYSFAAPTTLGAATDLDVRRSATGVYLYNCMDITLEDLVLDNPFRGVQVDYSLSARVTLRRIDASGTGRGRGVMLDGTGHRLEDVIADDREYGVYAINAVGLVVNGLWVDAAAAAGLYLTGVSAPSTAPQLSSLRLTRSTYGIQGVNLRVPMTWNASVFGDLSGNTTPLYLASNVADLTIRGLTLPSPVNGILAGDTNSARLVFEDLDVTGYCRGTGMSLSGTDVTLNRVVAGRRQTGFALSSGDRYTLSDSVAGANTTGITLTGATLLASTTVVADATNTATRFKVGALTNIAAGRTLRISLPTGAEDRVVSAAASSFVTLTSALSAVPPAGALVQSPDWGPRLTVQRSDVCANGTGLAAGSQSTTATGNYWRASTGPRHASVSGGTGDLVTGTAVTLSPFVTVPTDKGNPYCNQAPIADAGPDRVACEGDLVTLDGRASYDPDVEPLTYAWQRVSGPTLTLSDATTALATFTAPAPTSPSANTDTLTFELAVDDGDLQRGDRTTVSLTRRNPRPTALAGADQTVPEGASVALSAAGSFDPEGTPLAYQWTQTAGPAVVLTGATTAAPTFTAPLLDVGGGPAQATLSFALTVTDQALPVHCGGPQSHGATVTVVVDNVNRAPQANAGPDQLHGDAAPVTLDGTLSADPDGDALSWAWVQIGGPSITVQGATTPDPTFTPRPEACFASSTYRFRLTVADAFGGTHSDEVAIVVAHTDSDSDGDGLGDCFDLCAFDPAKAEPGLCGCGVADLDGDSDGTPACLDACDADPDKTLPGLCGCGVADLDGDGDGTPACLEACDTDPDKTEPGVCGCGLADLDRDGDLTLDCEDGCADDPDKTTPGTCGCGQPDVDADDDGIMDCEDQCVDGGAACAGLPFFLTVRTPTGLGQIACRVAGGVITCDELDGVGLVTPITDTTACE